MEVPDISKIFLSTPSARRATFGVLPVSAVLRYFYPRPPRGGRPTLVRGRGFEPHISIHALREEGDLMCAVLWPSTSRFLSTPSARRATVAVGHGNLVGVISIHALREEGDHSFRSPSLSPADFYPRPPRGGRLRIMPSFRSINRFLSTPSARRATPPGMVSTAWLDLFLSTPSARRATAKTETKSLFSNKLYNILHEFRRALIYNGSKSYPNHAK